MVNEANNTFSLRDFCDMLFRHKVSVLVFFSAAFFTVMVGVYLRPETYQAKACILVKVGRENVSLPITSPVSQHQVVASLGVRREDINSEIEILTSRSIVEEVVKKIGMDSLFPKATRPETRFKRIKYDAKQIVGQIKDFVYDILYKTDLKQELSPHSKAVLVLQGMFSAKKVNFSDVIEVQFRWFAPDIAEEILDIWLDSYLVHHSEAHRTSGEYDFFQKQVDVLGIILKESEDKLNSLKENEGISSYEDQKRLLLEQLSSFRASLKMTETELAEANVRIDQFGEKMLSLRTKITTGFSTVYEDAEKQLLLEEVRASALSTKKQKFEQHVETYQKDIEKLRLLDMQIKRLDRQIRIDEQNFELYLKKLEEARISKVLDAEKIANVRIIDSPAASPVPVSPSKLMIIGVGVVLSLLFGLAFVFLSEYLDHSIRTVEQVSTYLGLPLLASIRKGNR